MNAKPIPPPLSPPEGMDLRRGRVTSAVVCLIALPVLVTSGWWLRDQIDSLRLSHVSRDMLRLICFLVWQGAFVFLLGTLLFGRRSRDLQIILYVLLGMVLGASTTIWLNGGAFGGALGILPARTAFYMRAWLNHRFWSRHLMVDPGEPDMQLIRRGSCRTAVYVVLLLGLFGWISYSFHEAHKTDDWKRDSAPDAAMADYLAREGFPPSIYRVVEVGHSSRANGDGEYLTIYCFPLSDLNAMRRTHGSGWVPGLPVEPWVKSHILENAPADLIIGADELLEHFIHVPAAGNHHWEIINVVRGIRYNFGFRT